MTAMDAARLLLELVDEEPFNLPLFTPDEYAELQLVFERGAGTEDAIWAIQQAFNRL